MTRPGPLARLRRLLGTLPFTDGPNLPRTGGYPVTRRPVSTAPRPRLTRSLALALALALAAPTVAVAAASRPAGAEPDGTVTTRQGTLADGATWIMEVPSQWNGTVLLFAHGLVPPGAPNPAADASDPLTAAFLLDAGYALAGSSFATTGWAVEDALRDQAEVIDLFATTVGAPRRTIAWGASLGGLVSAAMAEQDGARVDGALSLCGAVAGGVSGWNSSLDILFAAKTLLAPAAPIQLTDISDPFPSMGAMVAALQAAQATPEGRARIALAAALGDAPGWTDTDAPEPDPADVAAQEANQFAVLTDVTVFLGIAVRADVEARAGGNPSANVGVDYGRLLRRSRDRSEVEELYRQAGLDLSADLATLAAAPRITADPAARGYLDQFVTLHGPAVPVLTVHNVADPLVPVEQERAYAATTRDGGERSRLRQAFVDRAGHCTFTPAETVAALQVLLARVETGRWHHATDPAALRARAVALGPELNVHVDDDTGQPVTTPPAFTPFRPGPFLRR